MNYWIIEFKILNGQFRPITQRVQCLRCRSLHQPFPVRWCRSKKVLLLLPQAICNPPSFFLKIGLPKENGRRWRVRSDMSCVFPGKKKGYPLAAQSPKNKTGKRGTWPRCSFNIGGGHQRKVHARWILIRCRVPMAPVPYPRADA